MNHQLVEQVVIFVMPDIKEVAVFESVHLISQIDFHLFLHTIKVMSTIRKQLKRALHV